MCLYELYESISLVFVCLLVSRSDSVSVGLDDSVLDFENECLWNCVSLGG